MGYRWGFRGKAINVTKNINRFFIGFLKNKL